MRLNYYNNTMIIKMLKNILIIDRKIKGKNKFENIYYFLKFLKNYLKKYFINILYIKKCLIILKLS